MKVREETYRRALNEEWKRDVRVWGKKGRHDGTRRNIKRIKRREIREKRISQIRKGRNGGTRRNMVKMRRRGMNEEEKTIERGMKGGNEAMRLIVE